MGRAAQMSGVTRLVGVQRTVQNNDNVKSEPKYLAFEESPIRAFYFWTLSCSPVALLASMVGWLLRFAESPAVGSVQHSFMHFAPQTTYVAKGQPRSPPRPPPRCLRACNGWTFTMDRHTGSRVFLRDPELLPKLLDFSTGLDEQYLQWMPIFRKIRSICHH